ncbi:hypothetical protein GCM10022251_30440 [Phytohabitans flavus]|uniref:Uncharacterized protein n=1 Tax=Phytohabitans flavus TaxID=1076124 RepID=A0A6F8XWY4_9ACTN|nr:hypothetical protein Pflav_047820 [Phytohabitans flavus]
MPVRLSSGSLPTTRRWAHLVVVSVESDRRKIVRDAWSARHCAEDRSAMIGLSVIRGLALAILAVLILVALI